MLTHLVVGSVFISAALIAPAEDPAKPKPFRYFVSQVDRMIAKANLPRGWSISDPHRRQHGGLVTVPYEVAQKQYENLRSTIEASRLKVFMYNVTAVIETVNQQEDGSLLVTGYFEARNAGDADYRLPHEATLGTVAADDYGHHPVGQVRSRIREEQRTYRAHRHERVALKMVADQRVADTIDTVKLATQTRTTLTVRVIDYEIREYDPESTAVPVMSAATCELLSVDKRFVKPPVIAETSSAP